MKAKFSTEGEKRRAKGKIYEYQTLSSRASCLNNEMKNMYGTWTSLNSKISQPSENTTGKWALKPSCTSYSLRSGKSQQAISGR